MLKINENEYNLDNLLGINFDLLKEILLKLAQKNNTTLQEINDIKNINISNDQRISDLEQKITELNNIINNQKKETEIKYIIKDEKRIELTIEGNNTNEMNINNSEKKPKVNNNLISIKKVDDFIITTEELNQLEENHANTEKNMNKVTEINNIKVDDFVLKKEKVADKNIELKSPKLSSHYRKKPYTNKKYRTDINLININDISLTPRKSPRLEQEKEDSSSTNNTIRNILHEINNIKDHVNFVEKNLLLKNAETLKASKDLLSEHNIQSMSKFNTINEQINNLISKHEQLDRALGHLAQKSEEKYSMNLRKNSNINPEIIQIFNSNDDEENDDKKIMPKTLMDSINKRFDLNNERYLKTSEDIYKMKQDITNNKSALDIINRQIESLKKNNGGINEDINKLKEQINELIEANSNLKNNSSIPTQNLNEINNYIDNKFNELMKNLLEENENKTKGDTEKNNNKNSNVDGALIKMMNKKLTKLNERIELIEEEFKMQKTNFKLRFKEIEELSKRLEELNEKLFEKLEKKDLDDIYILNKRNLDEINKMKLKVEELDIGHEKLRSNTPNFIKRLEKLTYDVSQIKDALLTQKGNYTVINKEYNTKVEESGNNSNDINEEKIKNMISPMAEEIQKLIIEIENINIKIKTISEQNKLFSKKKYIEKLETNLQEKISSIDNLLETKYLKKSEFQKMVKSFDIQIKQLQGNINNNNINLYPKQENENWILAKQPIKCFNCASCEANVNSNSLQPNEPVPWNKYHGQYRIGQGFSKLLKKLIEDKDKDINKTEKKTQLLNNSFENYRSNPIFMVNNKNENIKISANNNKLIGTEDKPFAISLKRYKLPKLIENFKRKQKSTDLIPISDGEKEENTDVEEVNPKILKITKLKNDENPNQNVLEINNHVKNRTGRNSDNKNSNLNRIQSLPLY